MGEVWVVHQAAPDRSVGLAGKVGMEKSSKRWKPWGRHV